MADLEGVEVKLGRRAFVVPPISCWAQEQMEKFSAAGTAQEQIKAMFEQMRMLLEPNYPDLTVEELKRAIPLKHIGSCVQSVMRAASDGLEVDAPGEAPRP